VPTPCSKLGTEEHVDSKKKLLWGGGGREKEGEGELGGKGMSRASQPHAGYKRHEPQKEEGEIWDSHESVRGSKTYPIKAQKKSDKGGKEDGGVVQFSSPMPTCSVLSRGGESAKKEKIDVYKKRNLPGIRRTEVRCPQGADVRPQEAQSFVPPSMTSRAPGKFLGIRS